VTVNHILNLVDRKILLFTLVNLHFDLQKGKFV
jgi:hypothetical protein